MQPHTSVEDFPFNQNKTRAQKDSEVDEWVRSAMSDPLVAEKQIQQELTLLGEYQKKIRELNILNSYGNPVNFENTSPKGLFVRYGLANNPEIARQVTSKIYALIAELKRKTMGIIERNKLRMALPILEELGEVEEYWRNLSRSGKLPEHPGFPVSIFKKNKYVKYNDSSILSPFMTMRAQEWRTLQALSRKR